MPTSTIEEKVIETRIINRHDTLDNWNLDTSVLLREGEIALAFVDAIKTDTDGKPVYDAKGKIMYVPTCVMKVGKNDEDGNPQKFSALPFVSAPASDVYAWAKKEEFDYTDSSVLKDRIENYDNILRGIGDTSATPPQSATVLDAIQAAINTLDYETPTDLPAGDIPLAVIQTDGKVSVTYGKITNANIAESANISMSKVENLTQIHETVYGTEAKETKDGLVSRVQVIENQLGDAGRVMEFVGTYKSTKDDLDKHTANGYFIPGSDFETAATETDNNVIKLQKGDVVAIVAGDDAGKEYVWSSTDGTNYAWEELGDAGATDKALEDFAEKVLSGGLGSKRLSGEEGAPTKSLEEEFFDRTGHLEAVTGSEGYDVSTKGSLNTRTEAIENKLADKVPQLDDNNDVLKIGTNVLIFDCGTATPRDYLGE